MEDKKLCADEVLQLLGLEEHVLFMSIDNGQLKAEKSHDVWDIKLDDLKIWLTGNS